MECQDVLSKIFCPRVPIFSVGESFAVALISGTERVGMRAGGAV